MCCKWIRFETWISGISFTCRTTAAVWDFLKVFCPVYVLPKQVRVELMTTMMRGSYKRYILVCVYGYLKGFRSSDLIRTHDPSHNDYSMGLSHCVILIHVTSVIYNLRLYIHTDFKYTYFSVPTMLDMQF